MRIHNLVLITLTLCCAGRALAETHTAACTISQAQAADAAVDMLHSWAAVAAFRTKFEQCDDGSIAEGSSEAIARLFVDHWDTLPELSHLIAKTPALQPFVLRHINSTLDMRDLEEIKRNAARCPNDMQSLCKNIANAAVDASGGQ